MTRCTTFRRLLGVVLAVAGLAAASPAGAHRLDALPPAFPAPAADGAVADAVSMPDVWSCTDRTTDDTANALTNAPRFKLIYAHTTDNGNRLLAGEPGQRWADTLQTAVRRAMAMVAQTSYDGSRQAGRTLRFDLGTACHPREVDIQTVALPRSSGEYDTADSDELFHQLVADVRAAAGPFAPVNPVAFVDGVRPQLSGVGGTASLAPDDRPGDVNAAQAGGLSAVVYRSATGTPTQPYGYGGAHALDLMAMVLVHEALHTLGAVQSTAPAAAGGAHVSIVDDVMSAGRSAWCPGLTADDPRAQDGFWSTDCSGDAYWNPDPAPGSYLASHWNVVDSAHLCRLDLCTTLSRAPEARIDASAGSATVGETVTFDAGATADPDGHAIDRYQWDLDGDGRYEREGRSVTVAFPTAGIHVVRLRATDGTGEFALTTLRFVVSPPAMTSTSPGTTTSPPGDAGSGTGAVAPPPPPAWRLGSPFRVQRLTAVVRKGLLLAGHATRAVTLRATLLHRRRKVGGRVFAAARNGDFRGAVPLSRRGRALVVRAARRGKVRLSVRVADGRTARTTTVVVARG